MGDNEKAVGNYYAELGIWSDSLGGSFSSQGEAEGVFGFFSGISVEQCQIFADALNLKASQIDGRLSVTLVSEKDDGRSIFNKLELGEFEKKLSEARLAGDDESGFHYRIQMAQYSTLLFSELTSEIDPVAQLDGGSRDRLEIFEHGILIDGEMVEFVGTKRRRERLFSFFTALFTTRDYQTMKDFSLRTEDIEQQPQKIKDLFDYSRQPTAGSKLKSEWFEDAKH